MVEHMHVPHVPRRSAAEAEASRGAGDNRPARQLTKVPLPKKKDNARPQSSRGGDVESRADGAASGEPLPLEIVGPVGGGTTMGTTCVPPRAGILRAVHGPPDDTVRPPSSLFDTGSPSRAGSACQQLSLRRSLSFAASNASLSPASIFSVSLMRTPTDTPSGGANAFDCRPMLVRCPAPGRPPRLSQSHQPGAARARALLACAGDGIGGSTT